MDVSIKIAQVAVFLWNVTVFTSCRVQLTSTLTLCLHGISFTGAFIAWLYSNVCFCLKWWNMVVMVMVLAGPDSFFLLHFLLFVFLFLRLFLSLSGGVVGSALACCSSLWVGLPYFLIQPAHLLPIHSSLLWIKGQVKPPLFDRLLSPLWWYSGSLMNLWLVLPVLTLTWPRSLVAAPSFFPVLWQDSLQAKEIPQAGLLADRKPAIPH